MNKDFVDFQKHFKRYQKLLGLTGYKVYFKYEPIDDTFANICTDTSTMIATVRLNSKLPSKDKPYRDIKRTARHEAIHLLLNRLESNAKFRYAGEVEINETVEELVNKLEDLIKYR